ncbi:MAG: MBOAT family protein [Cytophagaceae bacterium]|nr:MBOAT family protein [Cytophagaceae bacterium]
MLFNSLEFILFFPIVTLLYFVLPYKYRWFLLLMASCYFYMAFVPIYILILGFTIVVDYFAAIYIEKASGKKRRNLLIISLASNIFILAVFKYYNFINENLSFIVTLFGHENPIPFLKILLPIGLSFHTFQAMSYTIEVYRGNQKPEKHFGIYSLYVMFYPQLVAGPIERPQNILHQFYEKHNFQPNQATEGLKLILWGMFKKILIADRIAAMINPVFNSPQSYEGIPLILASILFAFQIYCDFSGYSDIAIGSAKVMGFKLMNNFNHPYCSRSISEFWSRWHISLSTWFRDYLYIPMGGNRVKISRWYFNLFFVFIISGLWHGANWTYIIWGALHGLYLICALFTAKASEKFVSIVRLTKAPILWNACQTLATFLLVCFAWVFFRASSFSDAYYISTHLFSNIGQQLRMILTDYGNSRMNLVYLNTGMISFATLVVFIFVMELIQWKQRKEGDTRYFFQNKPIAIRWSFYIFLVISISLFGVFHNNSEFIYFQF